MPKINVYLPDDLAAEVRAAGVPVSAVCQRALADAVRSINRARAAIAAIRDPAQPLARPGTSDRLGSRATPRLRRALELAGGDASPTEPITTADLLAGIVAEGDNLALRLLSAMGIDPSEAAEIAGASQVDEVASPGLHDEPPTVWLRLSVPARQVLATALEAALSLGHNYLGCEHLLAGLVTDEGSAVRSSLAAHGVDGTSVRRAIEAAVAGVEQGRASAPTEPSSAQLLARLDTLERRLAAAGI